MISSHRTVRCVRQWSSGAGLAAAAAAMIGMGTAHADTPDDEIGQAISDLNQGGAVLATADTADLGTRSAGVLAAQESIPTSVGPGLTQLETLQDGLSSGDQTYLANADEQLVTAAQNLISGDQAFVAADQAGQLTGNGFLPADLPPIEDSFGLFSAEWHALGATFAAIVDPSIGTDSAAAASSAGADPATLLSEATTNYTDANQLLAALPSGGDYAPNVATEIQFQDMLLPAIGNVGLAESALSSYDNGVLSDLLNPGFTSLDQGWDKVSEAALNADQALESAVATGSAADETTAVLGLIGPEYQALGPALQSEFIDVAAHLLTGGDFTSVADLAAGVDPVSALDPSIFADLLSSIGL